MVEQSLSALVPCPAKRLDYPYLHSRDRRVTVNVISSVGIHSVCRILDLHCGCFLIASDCEEEERYQLEAVVQYGIHYIDSRQS